MDVRYINPFLESIDNVFQTMLSLKPARSPVKISNGNGDGGEVLTSLVGITGSVHGVVVLRFPKVTAGQLAGRMLGTELDHSSPEVIDAISELVNMVAGAAKAKLSCDPPLQLGLPTVVQGTGYRVSYPSKSIWLEIPFSSEAGNFSMELTFSSN